MQYYKSFAHAMSHAADCFSEEIIECHDEGEASLPKFNSLFCASIWANSLDCALDDGQMSEEQGAADWRELYLAACDYFGMDAMAGFPLNINAALQA